VSLTFFSDRDLGRHIFPDQLIAAGIRIERHSDHFAHDTADEEWLSVVVSRGWVALTMDSRMIRRPAVQGIVMRSGARLLQLAGANAPTAQVALNFVNTLPRIERFLARHRGPLIARVYRPTGGTDAIASGEPGSIVLYLDLAQWKEGRRQGGTDK